MYKKTTAWYTGTNPNWYDPKNTLWGNLKKKNPTYNDIIESTLSYLFTST